MEITEREKEIIYFVLSRELDKEKDSNQFMELDCLRSKFVPLNHPCYDELIKESTQ